MEVVLDEVDLAYSRFRPDSEVRRVAARPGRTAVVSSLLARAVETALRAARISDGLVDPTVGRTLRAIGYDDDFDRVAARSGPIEIRVQAASSWRAIRFDSATRRLTLPPGVELDLGSTGKALASDIAAAAVADMLGPSVGILVSLGGDIATAGPAPAGGWRIRVAEDSSVPSESDGEVLAIDAGAVATSSTTVRRWVRGGIALHHIVDPRTGRPADGPWRTVTVVAGTCVDANIAATASIVRGPDAPTWLEAIGLPARLVSNEGHVCRVRWPEAADDPGGRASSSERPPADGPSPVRKAGSRRFSPPTLPPTEVRTR